MATFVLVHGGWHGGWCWRKVVPLLRAGGHEVHTPTLTGMGERAHLADPAVGLDVHTQDVAAVLEYEDLRDVVLVGHSSSGAVVSAVADVLAHRVRRLVYLDAFVPARGESVLDLLPAPRREFFAGQAERFGEGWQVPLDWDTALDGWGITDTGDREWMRPRLSPHLLAALAQPRPVVGDSPADALPRTYLHCRQGPSAATFGAFADRARAAPGRWSVAELDTGHDAMVTLPERTAALIAAESSTG